MAITLLRRHTRQQPALGARLERTHPLTQGLQHLWMGVGGQTLPDLVTGGFAYYEVNASNDVTPIGGGVVSTGVSGSGHGGGATAAGTLILPLFTYEAWFVANNFTNGATTVMGAEDNAYPVLIRLGDGGTPVLPNNQAQFVINNSKANGAHQLVAGALYHAVATYDGITQRLYINGALDASLTATTAIPTSAIYMGFGTDAYAGANYGGYRTLPGTIPLARLWSRALSATEVAQLYTDPYAMFQAPRLIVPTGSGPDPFPLVYPTQTRLLAQPIYSL